MTELRMRMLQEMQLRNLSQNTQKRYIDRVADFARHFGKSPEQLGPEDVRSYQFYLVQERKLSSSTLNVTVCARQCKIFSRLPVPWTACKICK